MKRLKTWFAMIACGILITLVHTHCDSTVKYPYAGELDSISLYFVPDNREGICDVRFYQKGREYVLKGETDSQVAKDEIVAFLSGKRKRFADSLLVLPDFLTVKKPWGLVNVSVCNMRSDRGHSAEMVSQAVMGTPVKILKVQGNWYLVQTPDHYLGWVDAEALSLLDEEEAGRWKGSERVVYMKKTGDIYADQSKRMIVSDIVAGSLLETTGAKVTMTEVLLPDGRKGFIDRNDAVPLSELFDKPGLFSGDLESLSLSFTGIPYLWGGTSVKGFDCSGFVKTLYYLNGVILARDASLQFRHGLKIATGAYPDSLQTGDLLFFGSLRDGVPRPTHVGMYIGDTEFIHAAGMVKINSLDSARANFSRGRRDSFLGVRRISGAVPGEGIQLISRHNWYINN